MTPPRFLLVNPTDGPESEYGALSRSGAELPQLGLAAVASALDLVGFHATIRDAHIQGLTERSLIDAIRQGGFRVVGFSVYITTMAKTFAYAAAIKRELPDVIVCVGGPQVTLAPQRFRTDTIDYIFIGEADESIVDFAQALADGRLPGGIEGVVGLTEPLPDAGLPLRLVKDIDALPPIKLDKWYPLDRFYPAIHIRGKTVVNVVSARGCPYKCTFCAAAEVNGRRVRTLSPATFVDLLGYYASIGISSFIFYDDTFSLNRKRTLEICREIMTRNLKIEWKCFSRVDAVDPELLERMRDAGCYCITFGCESLNDKTLSLLKKGFTVQQCIDGIAQATDAGIITCASFMIGLPGETEADLRSTIRAAAASRLSLALFPVFEPYEGTPIYDLCHTTGEWIVDPRYRNNLLQNQESVWVPDTMSRETVESLAQEAFSTFYLRPHTIGVMSRLVWPLPIERKIRLVRAGFDYFVMNRLGRKNKAAGSRYR